MKKTTVAFKMFLLSALFVCSLTPVFANDVVVDVNGKVGIGTATPEYILDIVGGTNTYLSIKGDYESSRNSSAINFGDNLVDRRYMLTHRGAKAAANAPLQIWYQSTQPYGWQIPFEVSPDSLGSQDYSLLLHNHDLVIKPDGTVSIGTTTPYEHANFHVEGTGGSFSVTNHSVRLQMKDSSIARYPYMEWIDNNGKRGMYLGWGQTGKFMTLMLENNNTLGIFGGNVGIGKSNPLEKFDVDGSARAYRFKEYSDERLKENVETIENSLELITKLRGVQFEWIDQSKGEGEHFGVIAQEVEQVFPEVVHTDSEGFKSVEYSKLVVPLIEAVKALRAANVELKNKNRLLEVSIEDIYARLDQLE